MISPDRNRFDFQILAYLVTIHLLYEMLPGSQEGEETTRSLKTQPLSRLWLSQLVMITWTGNETGNDHVTRAGLRALLPYVPVWKWWNTASYIRFSDGHWNTKTVDGIPAWIILP